MTTTTTRQTHLDKLLLEVTSLLVERAHAQLEREVTSGTEDGAANQLRRLLELDKELRAIRRDFGLPESTLANEPHPQRQVSRFYEVPGQEDA